VGDEVLLGQLGQRFFVIGWQRWLGDYYNGYDLLNDIIIN
jgi:hypothetical protein